MIKRDFETGGFPINRRSPVLCLTGEGNIYVVYNRFDLRVALHRATIVKMLGVWPGKRNTDCYVLNPSAYMDVPIPPAGHADIDSAADVVVINDKDEHFIRLLYRDDVTKFEAVESRSSELLEYIKVAGIKHRVTHESV